MAIKILPPEIQNQIAAGEVIERPANVLKELVENSLDAKSTFIEVTIKKGGLELIEVIDNGSGIPESELELALTRHATSKITNFNDLLSIATYGFRGEALPSIASVSRLTLQSKPKTQELGFKLEVEFGQTLSKRPVPMSFGTQVKVEQIFSNVPARLKFLKTPSTEKKRCWQLFFKQSLPHSEVEFKFITDNQEQIHFYAHETLLARLQKIWPNSIVSNLIEIDFQYKDIKLSGYTSKPESIQARGDRILLYVNKRPVQDKLILSAIRKAYEGKILRNEFPQVILFIDLPPELVDVNVHPSKAEVKFAQEEQVFTAIKKAIEKSIDNFSISIPNVVYSTNQSYSTSSSTIPASTPTPFVSLKSDNTQLQSIVAEAETPYTTFTADQHASDFVYLGQIDNSYLLLKIKNNFLLLDQHAAHERILFEQFKKRAFERKNLLFTFKLQLSSEEIQTLDILWKYFYELGFGLSFKQKKLLEIKAIPSVFSMEQAKNFLKDILAKGLNNYEDLLKLAACKASIKANSPLTPDEALTLISQWQKTPHKEFCPHGRPTFIVLNKSLLDPIFKRNK
ncbi:MAG: DNA mismatch repair endonuclease MutL [Desulfonauticus sp.]|nr:DNA mismatch repair endonuclease MutL [Desulfonauticus sp.]